MRKLNLLAFVAFAVIACVATVSAQKKDYARGESIQYFEHYTGNWEEGVFVEPSYDGSQPIIRTKPNQYFPKGEQKATTWDAIRALPPIPVNPPAAKAPGNTQRDEQPGTVRMDRNGGREIADNVPAGMEGTGGKGVLTRKEIINYLRVRLPGGPNAANAEEVRKQLIEEIKRRGVDFHEKSPGDIYTVGGYSVSNNIPDAINSNLGAPISQDWLMGTWTMYVYGGHNYSAEGNTLYSKDYVSKLGFLSINRDSTYTCKVEPADPPARYVKGTWRKATRDEMGFEGGAGIVLEKAADGADWIVMKYMSPNVKTDNIEVEHMQNRGTYRRVGERRR